MSSHFLLLLCVCVRFRLSWCKNKAEIIITRVMNLKISKSSHSVWRCWAPPESEHVTAVCVCVSNMIKCVWYCSSSSSSSVCCSFGWMVRGCVLPQCLWAGQKRCVSVCFVDIWHTVCISVGVCVFGLYEVILCVREFWAQGVSLSLCVSLTVCVFHGGVKSVCGVTTRQMCVY